MSNTETDFIRDIKEYTIDMGYIYSRTDNTKDLIMSENQGPSPVRNADPRDYKEYQIIN